VVRCDKLVASGLEAISRSPVVNEGFPDGLKKGPGDARSSITVVRVSETSLWCLEVIYYRNSALILDTTAAAAAATRPSQAAAAAAEWVRSAANAGG
jgi:hypothetical protein